MNERREASTTLLISVTLLCAATLFMSRAINTGADALLFYTANACLVSVGAIYLPSHFFLKKCDRRAYGLARVGGAMIPLSVIMGVCVYLVSSALNTALSLLAARLGLSAAAGVTPDFTGIRIPLTVIVMCVIPAFTEELLFHGVLLNAYRSCGKQTAIFATALIFTFMHADITAAPALFPACLATGLIAYETRSVYPAMIMHFTNNLLSYVTYGLASTDKVASRAAADVAASAASGGEASVSTLTAWLIAAYFAIGIIGFFSARKRALTLVPPGAEPEHGKGASIISEPFVISVMLILFLNFYIMGVGKWT